MLFEGLHTPRTGHSDPYRAYRMEGISVRSGQSGGTYGVVASGHFPDAFRHGGGHLAADDAERT